MPFYIQVFVNEFKTKLYFNDREIVFLIRIEGHFTYKMQISLSKIFINT